MVTMSQMEYLINEASTLTLTIVAILLKIFLLNSPLRLLRVTLTRI